MRECTYRAVKNGEIKEGDLVFKNDKAGAVKQIVKRNAGHKKGREFNVYVANGKETHIINLIPV